MNPNLTRTRALAAMLLALATAAAAAQAPATQDPAEPQLQPITPLVAPVPVTVRRRAPRPEQPAFTNPNVIVLDAAHGGTENGAADNGATFPNGVLEKDVTLALAARLRTALTAQGFTVVMTRNNAGDDVPLDARVELSNRSHALACLILHASNGGHGLHLYTSSMQPRPALVAGDQTIQPWDTAQASALPQSTRLLGDLGGSLANLRLPLTSGRASVKPIDSLNCPAVLVELAPLGGKDASTAVDDAAYQQRVADSLAQALVQWRNHWQTPAMLQAQTEAQSAAQLQAQQQAAAAQKAANQRAAAEKRLNRLQGTQTPGSQPAAAPSAQPTQPAPKALAQPRTAQPNTTAPNAATGATQPTPKARPRAADPDSMIVGDPVPVTQAPQPARRKPAPIERKTPSPPATAPQVRP